MSDVEKVTVKARFWWFVLYPDSAPFDWVERIQITGLPFRISPLHDKDINPDGSCKKPHYHIILAYGGPTTFSNVKKTITDQLNCPHPQYLASVKGACRYLVHKDNPEKFQYNENECRNYNGFDKNDFFSLTSSEEDRLYDALENFILENNCREFIYTVYLLKLKGQIELLNFFRRHTIYFREFINSIRYCGFEVDENGDIKTGGIV